MTSSKSSPLFPNTRGGFTLLELLLVVVIFSSLAFMMLANVADDTNQQRYDQTRTRLKTLRQAVVGHHEPALWAAGYMDGFVADTGGFPSSIESLVERPVDADEWGPADPIFYEEVDVDGWPESGSSSLALTNSFCQLMKGQRATYLQVDGQDRRFLDGWGNGALDDANHGWAVDTSDNFGVMSLGLNGVDGGQDLYEQNLEMSTIATNDWMVDLSNVSVKIYNGTGVELSSILNDSSGVNPGGSARSGGFLRAALLVFDANHVDRWRRIETEDTQSADWNLAAGETANVLTFPENTWVPMGEHILLLEVDWISGGDLPMLPAAAYTDATDLDDLQAALLVWSGGSVTNVSVPAAKRIRLYPGMSAPEMILEIR